VTALNEADFAHLSYKLQTVPARFGLMASMVGVAFVVVSILSDPTEFGIFPRSSVRTIVFVCGTFLFAGAVLFIFIFHTVRQLHLVNQMYRLATRINLFNLKALYAFSALTARSGLGLIFFAYFAFVGSAANLPDILNPLALILFGMWLGTGIAAFLLPLQGIHRRLVAEKERKISEVNSRFTMVIEKLHQNIEAEHFDKIADINQALTSLIVEREQLEKISTWPWEKGTLRGFLTAIAVPIFLWLLTRLLERLFNF
jgi:hypothetical protein